MTIIHLKNAALFDAAATELLEGRAVLVEDGRVVEVSDGPIKANADHTIDLAGRALLPGLIDAHVHVISVEVGFANLERLPESLIAAKARPMMEAMLMRGFTTVRDAGGADWGMAAAVEQGLIEGPRLFFSGKALSQTGGHGDQRPPVAQVYGCACGSYPRGLEHIRHR